jgi:hypothetical protein
LGDTHEIHIHGGRIGAARRLDCRHGGRRESAAAERQTRRCPSTDGGQPAPATALSDEHGPGGRIGHYRSEFCRSQGWNDERHTNCAFERLERIGSSFHGCCSALAISARHP